MKCFKWLLSFGLLLFPSLVLGQTAIPLQDATIALTSSGGDLRDPHLHVKYSVTNAGVNNSQEAVIQFNLGILPPGITASQIQEAELVLYVDPSSVTPGTITVCELASSPTWQTGTITGVNLPACNTGAQLTSFNVSSSEVLSGGFVLVNITPMVRDWVSGVVNNGIMLQADSAIASSTGTAVNARIDSMKDNGSGYPPQLQIILQQQGAVGPQGPVGPAGPQGVPGPGGTVGPGGITGPQGPQGLPGPQGATGSTGSTGPMGPAGSTGATGPSGANGTSFTYAGVFALNTANGYSANVVVTDQNGSAYISTQPNAGALDPSQDTTNWSLIVSAGAPGLNGLPGPQGAQGNAGESITGPQGPIGNTGAVGSTGASGPIGPQGLQGIPGVQGPAGTPGSQGAIGPVGPSGVAGAQGTQGPQGATGAIGPQGPQGLASTVAGPVGATGPAGAASTVAGPQGPTGPTGATGPAGSPYAGVWSNTGQYAVGQMVLRTGLSGTQGPFFNMTGNNAGDPATDAVNWAYLGGTLAVSTPIVADTSIAKHGNMPDPAVTVSNAQPVAVLGSFTIAANTAYNTFSATMLSPIPQIPNKTSVVTFQLSTSINSISNGPEANLTCNMFGSSVVPTAISGPTWCTSTYTPITLPANTYYIIAYWGGSVPDGTLASFNIIGGAWSIQ